jgi:hypothetical protein
LKAERSYSTQDGKPWPFDFDKIKEAAEEIERRKKNIEANYNQRVEQVKSELRRSLISIGIKQEEAKIDHTFATKSDTILGALSLLVLSLFIGALSSSIGLVLFLISVISLFMAIFDKGYSKSQVESAKKLQEEAKSVIAQIEKDRNSKLSQLELHCRSRIDHFKAVPIESISPFYKWAEWGGSAIFANCNEGKGRC